MKVSTYLKANPWIRLMRLDRPIGTYLLLWPAGWAVLLATAGQPDMALVGVVAAGVLVMRAAGCVVNDFADRHWDGEVERTALRPLASSEIAPRAALLLFFSLLFVALLLVLSAGSIETLWWAAAGAALTALYPFCKRFTHLPQLILGLCWAWCVPIIFSLQGDMASRSLFDVVPLFVAVLLWTIAFDTFYAMVDRDDDLRVGIKSTAVWAGHRDLWLIGLCQLGALVALAAAGYHYHRGGFFALGAAVAAGLFMRQLWWARGRDREACFKAFLNNHWVGLWLFVMLLADYRWEMVGS